jgi:hypothetical protein
MCDEKGGIKIVGQTLFFCFLFSGGDANIDSIAALVERLVPDSLEPCRFFLGGEDCHVRLRRALLAVRASFHGTAKQVPEQQKRNRKKKKRFSDVVLSFDVCCH